MSSSKGQIEEEKQILELHREKSWTSEAKGYMIFCGFWGVLPSPSLTCFQPWPLAPGTYRAKEKIAESRSIIFHIRSATDQEMLGGFAASPVSNEQFHGTSSAELCLAKATQHALKSEQHCLGVKGAHTSLGRVCVCVFNQFLHICLYTVGLLHKSHPNYLNICRAKLKLLYQSCIFSFPIFGVIFHPCVSLFQ